MSIPQHLETLARHIRTHLERVCVLDAHAMHFLDSSFSVSDGPSLRRFGDEGFENERELFVDLVLSPDHAFLRTMEPLVFGQTFNADDETCLIRMIHTPGLTARIAFPHEKVCLSCAIGRDPVERFVAKLRITFAFPAPVIAVMETRLTEPLRSTSAALIRQSGVFWRDQSVEFFSLFFRFVPEDCETLTEDLTVALAVMSDRNVKSIRNGLVKSLYDYRKRIDEIEAAHDMMKKNTMEVLMLQGVRVPSISPRTILGRIAALERLLSSVYGWQDHPEPPLAHLDLGDCVGEDGVKKMLSHLA